jgi:hypothetical protein
MAWKRSGGDETPQNMTTQPAQQKPTQQVEVQKPAIERSTMVLPPSWSRDSGTRIRTLEDSIRLKAGSVWSKGPYDIFVLAQKDQQRVANSTEIYTKDVFDTTFTEKSGRLSNVSFIAEAISIDVGPLTGALATYATTGDAVTRITNPAATALHSAANLLAVFQNYVRIRMKINGDLLLDERLGNLPDPYGGSGFAGSGAANDFNSYLQNGFGSARAFSTVFTLTPSDTIEAQLIVAHDFTVTQDCAIWVKLHGREIDSIARPLLVSQ